MVMGHVVEMEIKNINANNNTKIHKRKFGVQWHITTKCDQDCIHCYIKDEKTYRQESKEILNFDRCKQIIDSLTDFSKKLNANPSITFTGGDPLLHKDFFDIAKYAKEKGSVISILGNPYNLDNEKILKLKNLGIRGYQISIDGMKEMHDNFRKIGSFERSVKAINDLKDYGIRTVVMYTISKQNAEDLIPVMRLVNDLGVDTFAFARACGFGNGKNLEMFTPKEYRNILLKAYEEEKNIKRKGSKTTFNKKDHLWTLLLTEIGELNYKRTEDGLIYGGCSIGINSFSILADGTAFACRRFYSPIGKVPEQSIEDIFLSEELNKYRNTLFEKCTECDLLQYCRGCPAVAYGNSGNFSSPDPQCWK